MTTETAPDGDTAPGAPARRWDTDELPEGDEKVAAVRDMFDAIAPKYDRLNRIISFRLDVRWRKRAIRDLALPTGSEVLGPFYDPRWYEDLDLLVASDYDYEIGRASCRERV